MVECRLRVRGRREAWLTRFTHAHSRVRVEVLDRLEMRRGETMFTVRISPGGAVGWRSKLKALAGVRAVETLHASDAEELDRVFFRGPTYVPLLRELGLVRQFPFPIEDGVAHWTVVGPSAKVRALAGRLRAAREAAEIDRVRPHAAVDRSAVLTPRQREVLGFALRSGYFEVPRRISLTRLAKNVGVATSTLSVTLAVIERKVLGSVPIRD